MDVYRTPEERFAGLPGYACAPRYLERDGLRMHYVDEGTGDPVLLLHGQPTWSFLYRKLIPPLAAVARVVAPDYLGFGRSDKPTRVEDYSYDFHVESVRRLVEELDLRAVTVVVQDWGGPIGLRLAVEQPERFARLGSPSGSCASCARARGPASRPATRSPILPAGREPRSMRTR